MERRPLPPVSPGFMRVGYPPNEVDIPIPATKSTNYIDELYKRVKKSGISMDNHISMWDKDPEYIQLNPEEDYVQINKAIDNAILLNRLSESPPPIVAIASKGKYGLFNPPKWYYIKKDLPNY
jgi:hypothetical protein